MDMPDKAQDKIEPRFDDELIDRLLDLPESLWYDCKRIKDKLGSIFETIVAFANSEGGSVVLGLEDPDKNTGRDRVYGIQENITNWDEVRRLIQTRITDPNLLPLKFIEIGCTLRDGSKGSVVVIQVAKSTIIRS
jgi:ATP-dependent DNA helicase RecG